MPFMITIIFTFLLLGILAVLIFSILKIALTDSRSCDNYDSGSVEIINNINKKPGNTETTPQPEKIKKEYGGKKV